MSSDDIYSYSPAVNSNSTFPNNSSLLDNGSLQQETNQPLLFGIWASTPFFAFSIVFFVLFVILIFCGYLLDRRELKQCDVVFVEPLKEEDSFIYSVSLKIRKVYYKKRVSDIIMRIRGSLRDSPLILFRDSQARIIRTGTTVNIGFAVPFELGSLREIKISGDNSWSVADKKLFSFSDVSIRKLDKITLERNNSEGIRRARLQTWHSNETVKYWTKGSFFNSTFGEKQGEIKVVRARSSFVSLKLDGDDDELIHDGFLSFHYITSLLPRWHEAWSDYSHQDMFMIMKVDLLTGMFCIVCIYAFGLNWSMFGDVITSEEMNFRRSMIEQLVKVGTWTNFVEKDEFLFKRISTIFHSFMVATVSALLIIPISFIWKKLFSVIGGKGFYKQQQSGEIYRNITLIPQPLYNSNKNNQHASLNLSNRSFVLRTLECRNRHSTVDTYALKSRHFRMETVITNCEPDDVTARVIAFIRTKLNKLDDDDVDTGAENVRNSNTLHETRTLTSDVPAIDVPELIDNGNNNIIGVVRFCERIIQQVAVPYYVMDNSLIAECFIVTHKLNHHPQSLNKLPLQKNFIVDSDDVSKSSRISQDTRYYEAQTQASVQIGDRSSTDLSRSYHTSDGILYPSGGLKEAYEYQHVDVDNVKDKSVRPCCGSLMWLRFKKVNKITIITVIVVILNLIIHLLIHFPFCTGCSQFTVAEKPINLEHATLVSFMFLLFLYPIFCLNLMSLISLFFQFFNGTSMKQEVNRDEQYKV